jgi:hypothetical protein
LFGFICIFPFWSIFSGLGFRGITKVKKHYKSVEGTTKVLWGREVKLCSVHSPKFAQVGPLPKTETVETNLHASRGNQHGNPNQTAFPTTWGRHCKEHESYGFISTQWL